VLFAFLLVEHAFTFNTTTQALAVSLCCQTLRLLLPHAFFIAQSPYITTSQLSNCLFVCTHLKQHHKQVLLHSEVFVLTLFNVMSNVENTNEKYKNWLIMQNNKYYRINLINFPSRFQYKMLEHDYETNVNKQSNGDMNEAKNFVVDTFDEMHF
jgi:hypothetical protein